MNRTQIKICGITNQTEIEWLNELKPDYLGMILFFPKSKRNIEIEKARELLKKVQDGIKKVGVTVSPTLEQLHAIEDAGFDILQVHGGLSEEVLNASKLPIMRAYNEAQLEEDRAERRKLEEDSKVIGFLFDAKEPGSGVTFDWNTIPRCRKEGKLLILSGGLDPENVERAIREVEPDLVDVSSGVEIAKELVGKDKEKIRRFIQNARETRQD